MQLTDMLYLKAEPFSVWIEANPETVSLDANNVQKLPLKIQIWSGENGIATAFPCYFNFKLESVVGSSVTELFSYASTEKISLYTYTIPANSYPTANRISINVYDDKERKKLLGTKLINIVVENPVPFPRPEPWAANLKYKNGEYLMLDDVIYMWCSRVPGNTTVSPKADLSSVTPSGKWVAYQNWPLLATNIALIKFGLIGSAVFKDEYMYSQQGKTSSGVATSDYRQFGTNAFNPNLLIDFLRGKFKGKEVEVEGTITANAAFIKMHSFRANEGYFYLNPTLGSDFINGRPNRISQSVYMLPGAAQWIGMKISLTLYRGLESSYGYITVVTKDAFNETAVVGNEVKYCNKAAISGAGRYEFISLGGMWILTNSNNVSFTYADLGDHTYEDPIK